MKKILAAALVLFVIGAAAPVFAATTNFTGSTILDDWFDVTKWSAGIPTGADTANISGGNRANITAAGAVANNVNIDSIAIVDVSGAGNLSVGNTIDIGGSGNSSKLAISGGASVTTGSVTTSGNFSGLSNITVTGAGSVLSTTSMVIGASFNSTVMVADGGTINVNGGAGTLHVGSAGSSILKMGDSTHSSGTINAAAVELGTRFSKIQFAANANTNFGSAITGIGDVHLTSNIEVGLTAANTYSGDTLIDAGTLVVNNANGTISSSVGTGVVGFASGSSTFKTNTDGLAFSNAMTFSGSNNNIEVTGSNTLTLQGTRTGGGGFTKRGSGTLNLNSGGGQASGINLFEGTLGIGTANAIGGPLMTQGGTTTKFNAAMTVTNNIALNTLATGGSRTINSGNNNVILSGLISDAGPLELTGGPTSMITFNHANTFSGGLTAHDVTVGITNDASLGTGLATFQSNTRLVALADNLVVANAIHMDVFGGGNRPIDTGTNTLTLMGALTGNTGFTKEGTGTLIYNGDGSSYNNQNFTVTDGRMIIGDATHPSATIGSGTTTSATVNVNAILGGHGTLGGNLTNEGTVSPGGSVGTFHVNGNYIQNSSGELAITVDPTTASNLAVSGNATLAGKLTVTFEPGVYSAKTYTILTATNISGAFATITGTAPSGLTMSAINYGATAVTFDLIGTSTPPPVPPAPSGVSELGSTTSSTISSSNQASATIFDHLGESGSGDTGASSERDTLTFASLTNKSMTNSENTQQGLNGLAKALPEVAKKNGGWFKGTGNLASVESSGAKAGFSSETGGFLFGFDREVDKGVRIGAAGGYDHTSLSTFNGINATAETNSMRFAIYGSKAFEDDIALDAQIGYALHMIDGDRFESATGTIATNSHDANEYSTGFQVSKKFNINGFTFKPKAGLNYAHVDEDGYTETGAGLFNATIASKSINSLRLFTGFGISRHMKPRDGFAFTPEAHIKYSYEALDSTSATSGSQRGIGFASTGVEPSHHILTTGIGFSANLGDDLSAFGNYDVNLPTGNSFEQTFTVGMRLSF